MKTFFLFFFLYLPFNGYNQINLPLRICDNRILVEYEIFDKTMIMGFDTGSSINLIQMNSLPPDIELIGRGHINLGFFGAELYEIETPHQSYFGPDWYAVNINAFDDGCQIDGILSGNIIHEKVLEMDFKNGYLRIFKSSLFIPDQAATVLDINPSWVDYETRFSFTLKNVASISGSLLIKDTLNYNTQFLIDTGSKYEVSLLVNDSLLILELMTGEKKYTNHFFGFEKVSGYATVKYGIKNTDFKGVTDAYIFYEPYSILSTFGKRPIGVLLGTPFFQKFEKVTIDLMNNKLYLLDPVQK